MSTNEFTTGVVYIDEWGVLRYAAAAAFSAALYAEVTGDTPARELALSQLRYIAGHNSYERSFVVGFGETRRSALTIATPTTSRCCSRARSSAAPRSATTFRATGMNAIVITDAGYEDDVDDYVGNEVTLDYNAGLVGLAAFGVHVQRAATSP